MSKIDDLKALAYQERRRNAVAIAKLEERKRVKRELLEWLPVTLIGVTVDDLKSAINRICPED